MPPTLKLWGVIRKNLKKVGFIFFEIEEAISETVFSRPSFELPFELEADFDPRWLHYNDIVLCCSFLTLNLFHHLHMLLSGNLWLSMASLVICMHIRFLLNELQKQYQKHHTYRRVVNDMECKYPSVHKKGECAICWDTFSTARQLRSVSF